VVAALHDGVGGAAVLAKLAARATLVAFVALVALRTGEVLVVIDISIIRADAVLAMFPATVALVAVLAKLRLVEAVTAIHTKMLFPVVAFGTKVVVAVIVCLTIFAHEAVLALLVVGTLHAVGAEMLIVFAGEDAIAVRTAFVLAVLQTALLADAAFVALLYLCAFSTSSALRANPVVVLAAVDAVLATAIAPVHLFIAEAEFALETMPQVVYSTILAHTAVLADVAFASIANAAMLAATRAVRHTVIADGMFYAGRAFGQRVLVAGDNHARAAHLALQVTATFAMVHA
jgi:hypothetical protein